MKKSILVLKKVIISSIFFYFIIQIVGCSSYKGMLKFDNLKYPASMSAFLYDKNNKVVMRGKELDSISSFKYKKTYWSLAYGLIKLTNEKSLNDSLNAIIKRTNGDGIINLKVKIEQGVTNKIYSFLLYLPSYIPIFPSTAKITVSGEVVKLK